MQQRRGLYAVTDPVLTPGPRLLEAVAAAIDGGAVMVQYRHKTVAEVGRRRDAEALLELCRTRGVPLIINDDVELAAALGADGVHIGRDDMPVGEARKVLGRDAIIGVSCYDSLQAARAAAASGADYVAFGSFYPSTIKPQAVRAELELLRQGRARLSLPIAAIGGITPENGARLVAAGADLLAVITGVFGSDDTAAAARRYAALFA
jgi:thiamine-phosphate pyrophosphorylase